MDVGDRKGDVVHARFARAIQHEKVMVIADLLAAREHSMAWVFIADVEAERLSIKRAHCLEIRSEQDNVANIDGIRVHAPASEG